MIASLFGCLCNKNPQRKKASPARAEKHRYFFGQIDKDEMSHPPDQGIEDTTSLTVGPEARRTDVQSAEPNRETDAAPGDETIDVERIMLSIRARVREELIKNPPAGSPFQALQISSTPSSTPVIHSPELQFV